MLHPDIEWKVVLGDPDWDLGWDLNSLALFPAE
jgi:hypothetical protein